MTRFVPTHIAALAFVAVLGLSAPTLAKDKENRGVQSVHQPVVSYASYTYDVQAGGGTLSGAEAQRLQGWFDSIGLSYGDQISIVTDAGYYSPDLRDGIADVVARHGLLVSEDSSAVAGAAPDGAVRLIVRRATASVPGCPDWRSKAESNMNLAASSNYGCAVNSNLATMVANPEDLVRGQGTESGLRTATSNRAITTYREKALTGAGGLQQITAGN